MIIALTGAQASKRQKKRRRLLSEASSSWRSAPFAAGPRRLHGACLDDGVSDGLTDGGCGLPAFACLPPRVLYLESGTFRKRKTPPFGSAFSGPFRRLSSARNLTRRFVWP